MGYDRRFLSKEACHWVAEVLAGYGYKPLVVNRSSPTPLIMFTVKQYDLPYGMAVTASHNPAIYNGIKVFTAGGRDADKTVTNKIEAEIAKVVPAAIPEVDYDVALGAGEDPGDLPLQRVYRQHPAIPGCGEDQSLPAAHCGRPHVRRQPEQPADHPDDLPLRCGRDPRPARYPLRRQNARPQRRTHCIC